MIYININKILIHMYVIKLKILYIKLNKISIFTLRSSFRTISRRCLRSSCESCCPPSIHCIVFFLNEFNNSDGR